MICFIIFNDLASLYSQEKCEFYLFILVNVILVNVILMIFLMIMIMACLFVLVKDAYNQNSQRMKRNDRIATQFDDNTGSGPGTECKQFRSCRRKPRGRFLRKKNKKINVKSKFKFDAVRLPP